MDGAKRSDRAKRLFVLAKTVEAGNYRVPAEYVADAILVGFTRRRLPLFGLKT